VAPGPTEIGLHLFKNGRLTAAEVPDGRRGSPGAVRHPLEPRPETLEASPGSGELLVQARDVRFAYVVENRLYAAFLSISARVKSGIIACSAGKSTLSKLLVACSNRPVELVMFGRPARKWHVQDLANEVALVFQNPEHQFLCDTVQESLRIAFLPRAWRRAEIESRVEAMLSGWTSPMVESHPFALSAGAKRRLGVATMLVGSARLLIVDEPTYGQDKRMTDRLIQIMAGLEAGGSPY
jgi:energy-coupling factor transport system ATP-binding protein